MKKTSDKIWIDIGGKEVQVLKEAYVDAKTKMLVEFGYSTLTKERVAAALEEAINGQKGDVITEFIKSDLVK